MYLCSNASASATAVTWPGLPQASFVRRPTSGRDPHPLTEPSAKADGAFGKPLAAVSNSPCTVLNVSERHRHLGGFLRVDFLANGSSPLGA